MIRVGLAGCGRIARIFHLPALLQLDDVALQVVADPDPAALDHVRRVAPAVRTTQAWTDVVEADDVDAVVVCLPTDLHVVAGVAALGAGKHLYLEKPVAIDLDGCRSLDAARRAAPDLVAMAGFNFRFHPLYRAAGHALEGGAVGRIVGIRTVFASAPRPLPAWKQGRSSGGGALLDLASHHIDLVRLLFDEVDWVSATVRSVRTDADTATLTMGLRDDVAVQTFVTLSAPQQDRIEVVGDRGELVLDRFRHRRPVLSPIPGGSGRRDRALAGLRLARASASSLRGTVAPPAEPSFEAALGAFATAIAAGAAASPSLVDGIRSVAVVLAAERSAATGQRQPVDAVVPADLIGGP